MSRVGGLTKKFYWETRGLKVSGGQTVKLGTVLTRNGDRWKPGLNVLGQMHLTAGCDGEVYFTKKGRFIFKIPIKNTKPPYVIMVMDTNGNHVTETWDVKKKKKKPTYWNDNQEPPRMH